MRKKIKILHLEDLQADAELIDHVLKKGKINHKTFVVPDKAQFIKSLKDFSYDIILSDHALASFDSTDALRMVNKAGITVPFILVTAAMTDEFAARIMKEGANDYVLKDRLSRLPTAIVNSIRVNRMQVAKDTEQREADKKLRQLSARLQLATKSARMGIWDWDIKNNNLAWDQGMYSLYDIDSVQFGSTYDGWITRLHPGDRWQINEEIQWAIQGEKNYDTEFRVVWGDGSIHTIKATGIVEKDENGLPIRMTGANWDITLQKSTEQRLVRSETKLKEAQAIARMGNFEIDMINFSEVWSDQMYEILGLEKTGTAESFSIYIHPDDLALATEAFYDQRDSSMDYRLIRRDGVLRYVSSEWKFEFDHSGKAVRVYGVMQDITERKQGEMDRKKLVKDLLIRNADLEQFGYIISHNLRAPVANIIGASSALEDPGLTLGEKEILTKGISTSVVRLDNVIKDLNHILQVKSEMNDTKETVHFSALVDNIKISIQNLIDRHHIDITYDFTEVDEFLSQQPYLYSIFYNLISNSIKYRRVQVNTTIKIQSRFKNNKLEISFRDNGMGIDLQKNGADVFGLYKRFHHTIEGKGMGLFMVKTQVEALGGKISVKSLVNKGTEFKIEFDHA